MAVGFILIKTEPSKEQQVYEALGSVKEIVELHPLFGEFDLMAKVNTGDFYDLGQVVVQKIRTVEGVQDTQTPPATKLERPAAAAAASDSSLIKHS